MAVLLRQRLRRFRPAASAALPNQYRHRQQQQQPAAVVACPWRSWKALFPLSGDRACPILNLLFTALGGGDEGGVEGNQTGVRGESRRIAE